MCGIYYMVMYIGPAYMCSVFSSDRTTSIIIHTNREPAYRCARLINSILCMCM